MCIHLDLLAAVLSWGASIALTAPIAQDASATAREQLNAPPAPKRWIPWLEINSPATDVDTRPGVTRLSHGLEGLKVWEQSTDAIIITTVHERIDDLYRLLMAQKHPRTFLIGGFKASRFMASGRFEDAQAWRRIAEAARRLVSLTQNNVVLLECEGALRPFYSGQTAIDLEALAGALEPLSQSGVHVWWWGLGPVPDSAAMPDRQERSTELARVVAQAVPNATFLNAEAGMLKPPRWDQEAPRRRQRMVELVGRKRMMDLAYVHMDRVAKGVTNQFYTPADVLQHADRFFSPAVVIYPGEGSWLDVGQAFAALLAKPGGPASGRSSEPPAGPSPAGLHETPR